MNKKNLLILSADLLTTFRAFVALGLVGLGGSEEVSTLPVAAGLVMASWTSDLLDGPLARRSHHRPSWIGRHELIFDISVATSTLYYLARIGLGNLLFSGIYIALGIGLYCLTRQARLLGQVYQWPIWIQLFFSVGGNAPVWGLAVSTWLLTVLVLARQRIFCQEIPNTLDTIQRFFRDRQADKRNKPH